jgi:hypothetical protein
MTKHVCIQNSPRAIHVFAIWISLFPWCREIFSFETKTARVIIVITSQQVEFYVQQMIYLNNKCSNHLTRTFFSGRLLYLCVLNLEFPVWGFVKFLKILLNWHIFEKNGSLINLVLWKRNIQFFLTNQSGLFFNTTPTHICNNI